MADFKRAREAIRIADSFIEVVSSLCPDEGAAEKYGDLSTKTEEDLESLDPYVRRVYTIEPNGLVLAAANYVAFSRYKYGNAGTETKFDLWFSSEFEQDGVSLAFTHNPASSNAAAGFEMFQFKNPEQLEKILTNFKTVIERTRALRDAGLLTPREDDSW